MGQRAPGFTLTTAEGFPWPMTTANAQMQISYNVTRQAAHMAIDSNGVVVSAISYGGRRRRVGGSFSRP